MSDVALSLNQAGVVHTSTVRNLRFGKPVHITTTEGLTVRAREARISDDLERNRRTVDVWGVPARSSGPAIPGWYRVPTEPNVILLHGATKLHAEP